MKILALFLLCGSVLADVTPEQAELMRQYHLSVPPTIIKAAVQVEAAESEQSELMRQYHLSVPPIIVRAELMDASESILYPRRKICPSGNCPLR